MEIVFVGGIHGVGKSTVCPRLSAQLGIPHFTASELIRREVPLPAASDKRVADMDVNQELLIKSLREVSNANPQLILDGHFCLLQAENAPVSIPIKVFQAMNAVGLILITEKPEVVQHRLVSRDGINYPLGLLQEFLRAEGDHAEHVARAMEIPLLTVEPNIPIETVSRFSRECLAGGAA